MMKCVKKLIDDTLVMKRVKDGTAEAMVGQGWSYVSKSMFREWKNPLAQQKKEEDKKA